MKILLGLCLTLLAPVLLAAETTKHDCHNCGDTGPKKCFFASSEDYSDRLALYAGTDLLAKARLYGTRGLYDGFNVVNLLRGLVEIGVCEYTARRKCRVVLSEERIEEWEYHRFDGFIAFDDKFITNGLIIKSLERFVKNDDSRNPSIVKSKLQEELENLKESLEEEGICLK